MRKLSWLHLSDLHQGIRAYEWSFVQDLLFADLERLAARSGPWDLVLFTGDLTQSGTKAEFDALSTMLEALLKRVRNLSTPSDPVVLAVPGNHDLQRPRPLAPAAKALSNWHDDPDLRRAFWENNGDGRPYRELVREAFAAFEEWFDTWRSTHEAPSGISLELTKGPLPGDFAGSVSKDGLDLGIVGLNSAFLQLSGSDYEGRLDLDSRQLAACGGDPTRWVKRHDAALLLTHHPYRWLCKSAKKRYKTGIAPPGLFAAHLFGHMHKGAAHATIANGVAFHPFVQARSLFGLESWGNKETRRYGYSAGRIDIDDTVGILRIWPRAARRVRGALVFGSDPNWHLGPLENCVLPIQIHRRIAGLEPKGHLAQLVQTARADLEDRIRTIDHAIYERVDGTTDHAERVAEVMRSVVRSLREIEDASPARPKEPTPIRLPASVPPARSPLGIHHMPRPVNHAFIGRMVELQALATAANATLGAGGGGVIAVKGQAQVGKTELAVEFVHRYGHCFEGGVFWIDFRSSCDHPGSSGDVQHQIAQCGWAMGAELPRGLRSEPLEYQISIIRQAWEMRPRLLVFDDCTSEQLHEWRPRTGPSLVLVTCRSSLPKESISREILVQPLDEEESVRFLLECCPALDVQLPAVHELVQSLGGLPLALKLAAAYLSLSGSRIESDIIRLRDGAPHPVLEPVCRQFSLMIERLSADRAFLVLQYLACCAPGVSVPRDLVSVIAQSGRDRMSRTEVWDRLTRLRDLGLVTLAEQAVLAPALLAQCVKTDDSVRAEVEAALHTEAARLNDTRLVAPLAKWQVHLHHAVQVLEGKVSRSPEDTERLVWLRCELGRHLHLAGDYASALRNFERVLELQVQLSGGEENLATAEALGNLGQILQDSGRLAEAEPHLERAVRLRERLLGDEALPTAASRANLALLWIRRERMPSAIVEYERVLSVLQRELGSDHPATAMAHNDLGSTYRLSDQLDDAQHHLQQALEIQERRRPDHPDTAVVFNNCALLNDSLAKSNGISESERQRLLGEARRFYERSLELRQRVLGMRHPDTATAHNNLGGFLREQGELTRAEEHLHQALVIRAQVLGSGHWRTAITRNVYGRLKRDQGRWEEAMTLHREAHRILNETFGPDHGATRRAKEDLDESLASMVTEEREAGKGPMLNG